MKDVNGEICRTILKQLWEGQCSAKETRSVHRQIRGNLWNKVDNQTEFNVRDVIIRDIINNYE